MKYVVLMQNIVKVDQNTQSDKILSLKSILIFLHLLVFIGSVTIWVSNHFPHDSRNHILKVLFFTPTPKSSFYKDC